MNQNLRVRRMEAGDLLRAAALEQSSFSQPWSEKLLAEGLNSPLDTYFVCTCENEIAGYCVLRVLADEGERAEDCGVFRIPQAGSRQETDGSHVSSRKGRGRILCFPGGQRK